jgi:hypothetical protein
VSLRDSATPGHPRALLDDGQRARRADPARRRIGSRSTTRAAGDGAASGRPVGQLYVAEIKPYHYASVFEEGAAVIVTSPSHSGKLPRQL